MKSFCAFTLLGLSALLGGCGDSQPAASGGGKTEVLRGIIASASDCTSFGPEAVKACSEAIERAVTRHESVSTTYNNIEACETAVGESKCERAVSGKYRQRLAAFLVALGTTPRAEPLYPAKNGAVGFQSADRSTYLASDRSITFSRLALSVAESEATPSKTGRRS
ncbi:DUF1190 domain-containing protein [Hyphomicrobium sp. LHD-15]|uniref:DUF1190 domain-containing protein n=1 Tax=Hyphomicrobium sp. LHD-15 TaxID=3072142 RepID=UPI00280F4547|nr:DUF1190 domain-containing protein [Hyphomicrobium sp. LHD-15]MDQ8697466.1 DUF1190 domain-containing protein [Hyphomicrobium sp. LHD-15]